MIIEAFPSGPFETNAYVVSCPQTREAAIIDPAPSSSFSIMDYISNNQLIPKKILLTHSHWDHFADAAQLKKFYKIPLYIHELDAGNVIKPGSDGLPSWIDIQPVKVDHYLQEGEKISVGNIEFEVIYTPGHTPGGVCFYSPNEGILFSGDTLFRGTIGSLSFPTARPYQMWDSLKKLSALPSSTQVYPGHGPKTTIHTEGWLSRAEEFFGNI